MSEESSENAVVDTDEVVVIELDEPVNPSTTVNIEHETEVQENNEVIKEENQESEEESNSDEEAPGDEEAPADEEDPVDPMDTLREACGKTKHCSELMEIFEKCEERVKSKSHTEETCAEELLDFFHCQDECMAKDLFKHLK